MSRYCQISAPEMRGFLKPENNWVETIEGNEIVFCHTLKHYPSIQLKVFSGIKSDNQISRECGKDAIRVCATRNEGIKVFGWIKSNRVYRVQGWQKNLKERVISVINESEKRAWSSKLKRI